ncbi:MAG: polysaccharide deacetylase family protein [Candidatus Sungbacteria bacterium]|nr:polysaccharide deacetylase family protein [Candidatus Sungbacteria bacterium]
MEALHLGYHYIRNGKAPGPTCSPERLRAQISRLKEDGYKFMTCGQVARQAHFGSRQLPEKHVTLSFDDGFKDQFTAALPILMEFEVPATFFVITCALDGRVPPVIGFQIAIEKLGEERLRHEILPALFKEYGLWSYGRLLEKGKLDYSGMKMGEPPELRLIKAVFNHFVPPSLQAEFVTKIYERYAVGNEADLVDEWFMNADELLSLAARGMEIASHSHRHPWFSMIGENEIEYEMRESSERIKNIVGTSPTTCGWVFGNAVPRREAQLAARRTGYTSAWNFWSAWSIEDFFTKDIYHDLFDIPRLHEHAFNP